MLTGKTILVTGGTGAIGSAICRTLAWASGPRLQVKQLLKPEVFATSS